MPMPPKASLTSSNLNGLTIASIFFILRLIHWEPSLAARPAFAGRGNAARVLFPIGGRVSLLVSAACFGAFSSRNASNKRKLGMCGLSGVYGTFIFSRAFLMGFLYPFRCSLLANQQVIEQQKQAIYLAGWRRIFYRVCHCLAQ